ncbi:hypothetical protein PITC_034390 [Penicillium italicum]|uniref:F-box domain-containing protein n=1 Tax=Penicillium italicum TaxID=40296 RepID=A0A0A2LG57_PENIT|nr:hypothetical protein PITC_034390 [Penicillium italicum]
MGTHIACELGIHSLPVELLAYIAKFTESPDLCALRLTCRAIYQGSLRHFAQTVVHTLKTDLSPKSLARVEEAANDDIFCPCVRKLEIVRDSQGCLGPFSPDRTSEGTYIQAWRDVIKRLFNCQSFELRNSVHATPSAGSDGITLDEATGVVLEAIATERIPMESFSIDIIKYRKRAHQDKDGLTQFAITAFGVPAFANLRELSLALPDAEHETIDWMAKMIQCAQSLRKLTIIFSWSCEATSLLAQISSVECLPELQELTFSRMSFQSSTALAIFLYSIQSTLRRATFSFVQLEFGGWRSILRELGGGVYRLDSVTLRCIQELDFFLSFRNLPEYPLAEESLDRRLCRPFQFCFVDPKDTGFTYSGPALQQVLQRVVALAELP